jgi:hypothetical protein
MEPLGLTDNASRGQVPRDPLIARDLGGKVAVDKITPFPFSQDAL